MTPGRLETRRPYERGKIPVVFIHGLWGSPRNWDRMIEDLDGRPCTSNTVSILDRSLREWGLDPLLGPLAAAVPAAERVELCDPEGTDAALDQMVVVGHSLGGILAKMMVQSGGPRLWQTVCTRPIDQVIGPTEELPASAASVLLQTGAGGAPGHLHRDPPSRQPACQRLVFESWVHGSAGDQTVSAKPMKCSCRTTILTCSLTDFAATSRRAPASLPPGIRSF